MHQGDTNSSYYQYYQSHFQSPNTSSNPNDPPQINPTAVPTTFASAPPVASNYAPYEYSGYSSSSSSYPSYPQYTDQASNPPPIHLANPNPPPGNAPPQPYSFPHLNPQPSPNYAYDQNQPSINYDHLNPSHNSIPNSSFSQAPYSAPTSYDNLYEGGVNYGRHGDQGIYGDVGKRAPEVRSGYDYGGYQDGVGADGVYAYRGGNKEPYGARGTGRSDSSSHVLFDDYGRPIGSSNRNEQSRSGSYSSGKVVKAIPKAETQQDAGSGVQKYRVKLLPEGAGSDMDVLCQVGLDGIRLLDPSTSRMLRVYPLETLTRWEVLDSYIFAFWAKSSVDVEPRRIRLKSNSYTSNNILDTVTAATFQIKEIGGRNKPSDPPRVSEQSSDKKKGIGDWMNLMKPRYEEKDHWVPDEAVTKCTACGTDFGAFVRRHHCRNCGDIFCDKCTQGRIALNADENVMPVRVCDRCMAEVTQRLANAKETSGRVAAIQSHDDLAKKLKEEMDKNRKASTGGGSGTRMKEVACPTCTVHLQVQVPASGSETIECSVCQHPFLVNAY
ncbi:hypothetical protein NMG60_11007820 [Bertholletia excelsa]